MLNIGNLSYSVQEKPIDEAETQKSLEDPFTIASLEEKLIEISMHPGYRGTFSKFEILMSILNKFT